MEPTLELLTTAVLLGTVFSVGSAGILVLPWTNDEQVESAAAFYALPALVARTVLGFISTKSGALAHA